MARRRARRSRSCLCGLRWRFDCTTRFSALKSFQHSSAAVVQPTASSKSPTACNRKPAFPVVASANDATPAITHAARRRTVRIQDPSTSFLSDGTDWSVSSPETQNCFEDQKNLNWTDEENMSQTIAKNRMGRVLLHTVCALRDHHWTWHWRGIVREFSKR